MYLGISDQTRQQFLHCMTRYLNGGMMALSSLYRQAMSSEPIPGLTFAGESFICLKICQDGQIHCLEKNTRCHCCWVLLNHDLQCQLCPRSGTKHLRRATQCVRWVTHVGHTDWGWKCGRQDWDWAAEESDWWTWTGSGSGHSGARCPDTSTRRQRNPDSGAFRCDYREGYWNSEPPIIAIFERFHYRGDEGTASVKDFHDSEVQICYAGSCPLRYMPQNGGT